MTRFGMLMDVTKCTGCYNCFLVCKDEHCGTAHPGYAAPQPMTGQAWMRIAGTERGRFPKVKLDYTAIPCMHCDSPACVEAAGKLGAAGAVSKRKDGIVLIDPEKAKGKKELVESCPYRVIFWNEEEQVPQKCTLCAHLLDEGWKEPRCVEACPNGALLFGDLDDKNGELAKALAAAGDKVDTLAAGAQDNESPKALGLDLPGLKDGPALDENVRYIGLPKTFVAGAVVIADSDECAVGITVTLKGVDLESRTITDAFGDFEFEDLPRDKSYQLKIEAPGFRPVEQPVKTNKSVYLGDILQLDTASHVVAGRGGNIRSSRGVGSP